MPGILSYFLEPFQLINEDIFAYHLSPQGKGSLKSFPGLHRQRQSEFEKSWA